MSDEKDPAFFTVISANGLKSDAEGGTFVTVSMGNQTLFRTKSVTGESPQWNDSHPIPVSGPRSFSIAIQRESPKGNILLGEVKEIIVDISSAPAVLFLPVEQPKGGRQIVVKVSIRNSKDMSIPNDDNPHERLVCLSNFVIKSSSDRHPDLQRSARLSVAVVVSGDSLYETTPLKKEPSESDWNCTGKVILSSGMPFTLQVINETASKKRLGFVQLDCDALEILQEKRVKRKTVQYTNEDPWLEILFTAQVLGYGITDTLPQDGESTGRMDSGIHRAELPLGNALDSHRTGVATLNSRLPSSSHSRSALSGSDRSDIPGRQITGFLSKESSEVARMVALGIQLLKSFELEQNPVSLEKAISVFNDTMKVLPDGHKDQPFYLFAFGRALHFRFWLLGKLPDINPAIEHLKKSISLFADGHPSKAACITELGIAFQHRFERLGDISDLKNAISVKEKAVQLTPTGHPNKAVYLDSLGGSYYSLFQRQGEISALEKAISVQENAVLTPIGHPDKAMALYSLSGLYGHKFERSGELSVLDKAIFALEDAVQLTPTGHPDKTRYLNQLGILFHKQFERLGEISVLEKAISLQENVVQLTPTGDSNKPMYLNNLGTSYKSQFDRLGEVSVLEMAISVQENAVELAPAGHPDKVVYLNNLGVLYQKQFERLGGISVLEKAISVQENTLVLTPTGHPLVDKALILSNLSVLYGYQFERFGEISVLEKAISAAKKAVELTPTGHPNKALYLNNLGISYKYQFERFGEISVLVMAISLWENVVELTPTGDPAKPMHLSNLAISYQTQFERLGEISALGKAISALENAVELIPTDHPRKAVYLNNLGLSYHAQFERLQEISDLEKSISAHENAVELTPTGHPSKAMYLSNLGLSYHTQFQRQGEISVLEKAISVQEDAIELIPTGHPGKALYLNNLSNSYRTQFEILGEISALEKAIYVLRNAVDSTPNGHAMKALYLCNLGQSYKHQFECLGETTDLEKAVDSFRQASQSSSSQPNLCFKAAVSWAECNEVLGLSPIEAFDTALHLLPLVAWIGLTIHHRYTLLSDISGVVHDAAIAAISSGKCEMALEWLEQGRSIVWGQLFQLRTPVDDLKLREPELATQLLAVSQALDKASAREIDIESGLSADKIAQKHHLLAIQWDKLIQQVHLVPGFEGFLHPKRVSQLIPAASLGHVVVISIHETGCDALILKSTSPWVVHIPLKGYSEKEAREALDRLRSFQQNIHARSESVTRARSRITGGDPESWFRRMLSQLWTHLVKPVLDRLAISVSQTATPPRIWWCPTGPLTFLPIHAAGDYSTREPGSKIFDYVVSSYTPTVTALLNSISRARSVQRSKFQLLAVCQSSTAGQHALPNAEIELDHIKRHAGLFTVQDLRGKDGTVERVIQGMSESTWVHLACHGTQDAADPTKSALILADGNLELSRIMKISLPQAEFAFLSACQSAAGDVEFKEEVVHVAAGMLMAGYRGVIATMWSIRDEDGPLVANDVYTELFKNGDHTRAAHALHRATENLRRSGAPFISWVPFIHMGM